MGNVAKTAGVALAGIGAVGVAGFGALAAAGITANASLEQTKVAFTTLLGSGERAGAFLKDLSAFAAATPFEFPELAGAAQKLLAFGFEAKTILPLMTSIGDAVGALGGSAADVDRVTMALGQMQAKGKASNEELLQMAELGLPVYDILSKAFGKSTGEIQKMVSDGLIPADQAIQALATGLEDRFGGSMAQQSQTFNGLLSTLQDNARLALQAFTGPLFEQAKGGLETLGNLVASPAFQQFAADMGQKVGGALATVVQWLTPLVQGFYQIGAAILSSSDPIATILDLLDTLIPGFADAAASAYQWGANIVSQLAAGMGAAVSAIISVISEIAGLLAYWFAPGSPPKVAPEIDQWGAAAGTEFFQGIAGADTGPLSGMTKTIATAFDDLSGQVNTALQNMVDIGALGDLDRIPALQGFRQQIAGLLTELDQAGRVSDTTWQRVTQSLGPVAGSMTPVIRAYVAMATAQDNVSDAQATLDQITGKYTKQLDGLNSQLKTTQRAFDQALRPFNDQLNALDQQEAAIKRVQRAQEARATLKDPAASDEEKALAQLELQRIELEKQMAPIAANKAAAVQAIQDQIDAAETQRDAAVSAAQATLDTYTAQLDAATALYQNEQARVGTIQESNSLLAEQARLVDQAAKAAASAAKAGGGGGAKGGGGLKLPAGAAGALGKGLDLPNILPEGTKEKLADAGKAIDDVKTKLEDAKKTIEGWRASFDTTMDDLSQKWAAFKSILDTIAPVIGGIAAGLGAFAILSTVAGWVGGLIAAWGGLSAAFAAGEGIAGVVALLGGPLTLALVAIAAAVGVLTAAWLGNWGGIRDTLTDVWTNTLQPALADLKTWLDTNLPPAIQALADFWTNTLQPALNTVWSFIQSNIIPILQVLADTWIAALKLEVQALADLWTGTLQPALSAVWDFIQNSVIPLFQALWNVEIAALKLALRELSDVWTGTLQPALQTAYDFFNANILPVLKTVADVVTNTVGAAFGGLATKIGGVGEKLSGLKSIIDGAIGWLNGLAQKIDSVNSKPKPSYGAGGGSDGSFDDGSSGSSKRGLMGMSRSMQALQLPLNGITQQMQQLATAMTFVADREQQLAITKALSDKFKALQGDAKTTAALYAQLGDNVKFLADAMTTYKQVENTDKKGKGVGTYHTEVDQYKLTESQVAAFKREFDKAAQDAYTIQQQYGQEAAKAYYDSQSTYLQDEANLQVAYNQAAQDGNTAQMAALTEQMNLRYKQHEAELAALEEEQGAALAAIEAQKQAADAAYNAAMQHIKDIFEAQRRANLKGAADLYSLFSDTSGQLADMLANAYQTAYDSALGDAKLPDPGTLSNAELEQAYAAYQAKVTDAEAAGTAAQAKIQAVQQQLLDLQQQALQIAQVDPQAAADFYAMEQKYVLQVSDLQDKIANATSDQQRAALQQQLDYLEKSHSYQEQLFQANLDQYGQNLSDAQQAAQDAAAQTGDSALQTYANQIGQMFVLFQQQLSGAVASATMTALHLPTATMPNLTNRSGGAPAGGVSYGDIHITVNGAQTQNETHLAKRIGDEIEKRLQAKAESAARLSRGAGNKRY